MKVQLTIKLAVTVVVAATILVGCAGQQTRARSSVVDYLYPESGNVVVKPSTPVLTLPLKVGVAFVPDQNRDTRGFSLWSVRHNGPMLTEAKKTELLNKVAEHFRKYDYVSEIEVIPSAYLTPRGGFSNLDQIKTMYGTDVIALVSYDQVQFTDEGALSLTYWTLVGAYIFSGEKNDTSTMMDTAVYDITSRKMLFRAPGVSNVNGSATPINLSEELRADSLKSFTEATDNMIANLDQQLANFREKIKTDPTKATIVKSSGYTGGGGAMGMMDALLLLSAALLVSSRRRFMKAGREY